MPHLFEPLKLRDVTFRNRIGVSPMCQYSSQDGFATDWHLVHLGSRAVGGAGLVVMEATAVEARGRISPGDNGIYSDEHVAKLSQITSFIESQGAVPGIQIAHAGRKASRNRPWEGDGNLTVGQGAWEVVGPSAIAFGDGYKVPHELTVEEIKKTRDNFVAAARRSLVAGFKFLELHAAHGYLLNSFLSPISNQRKDQYGGNFENRTRFLLETVRATRQVWPLHLPLAIRFSCSDWVEGGWTAEDSVALARLVKKEEVDLIDCSSGGNSPAQKIPVGAGYQVPFSDKIRNEAGIPTGAVGMITQAMQADELIRNGRADLIFLARELLRDPYWPLHAAQVVHQLKNIKLPNQYLRAF